MKIHEFTFVPEDRDKPIKVVYEDDFKATRTDGFIIEIAKKLTHTESEKLLNDMFGTTNVGILDCSYMSDEEFNKIVDKWNSIPEEYIVPIKIKF